MIDLTVKTEKRNENIRKAVEEKSLLPNVAQLRTPDLIPQTMRKEPLFHYGWYNCEDGCFSRLPAYREILPEESGVPCRILALTGDPNCGAEFFCRMTNCVTGQDSLDAAADTKEDLRATVWHYNVTGWALCDLFESRKQAGERLFGVCFGSAEGGLSAAGDLIKARYPRAKLAVGADSALCNFRGVDVLCDGSDPVTCCAAVARYFELDERDVLLTVLPEESSVAAGIARELTYPEKKALHLQQKQPEAMWQESFWGELYDSALIVDRLVNEFNDELTK